jgi:hypothetical protein
MLAYLRRLARVAMGVEVDGCGLSGSSASRMRLEPREWLVYAPSIGATRTLKRRCCWFTASA